MLAVANEMAEGDSLIIYNLLEFMGNFVSVFAQQCYIILVLQASFRLFDKVRLFLQLTLNRYYHA